MYKKIDKAIEKLVVSAGEVKETHQAEELSRAVLNLAQAKSILKNDDRNEKASV